MGLRSSRSEEENLKKLLSDCMDDDSKLVTAYQTHFGGEEEDTEFLYLLNDHFTTLKGVSKLCESLRKYLHTATEQHDDEKCDLLALLEEENVSYKEASFRKTLQDLKNYSEFFGFLAGEFHDDLANMIVKLDTNLNRIDKKLYRVQGLKPFVARLVAFKNRRKSKEALKREKTLMGLMIRAMMVTIKTTEKISRLVNGLEIEERSVRIRAEEIANKIKQSSVEEVDMEGIGREMYTLKSMMDEVDKLSLSCDDLAKFSRTVARQKIVEFLSRATK